MRSSARKYRPDCIAYPTPPSARPRRMTFRGARGSAPRAAAAAHSTDAAIAKRTTSRVVTVTPASNASLPNTGMTPKATAEASTKQTPRRDTAAASHRRSSVSTGSSSRYSVDLLHDARPPPPAPAARALGPRDDRRGRRRALLQPVRRLPAARGAGEGGGREAARARGAQRAAHRGGADAGGPRGRAARPGRGGRGRPRGHGRARDRHGEDRHVPVGGAVPARADAEAAHRRASGAARRGRGRRARDDAAVTRARRAGSRARRRVPARPAPPGPAGRHPAAAARAVPRRAAGRASARPRRRTDTADRAARRAVGGSEGRRRLRGADRPRLPDDGRIRARDPPPLQRP